MATATQTLPAPALAAARKTLAAPTAYWRGTPTVALLALGTIGLRSNELIPYLWVIKPVLLIMVFGVGQVFLRSRPEAIQAALRDPLARTFLGYAGWALITVPFAMYGSQALGTSKIFLAAICLVFPLLLVQPTRANLDRVTRWTVWLTAFVGLLTLAHGRTQSGGRLETGGTMDPNDLAAVMAFGAPIALALARRQGRLLTRLVALGCLGVMVLVILKTGSRGGFLALSLGLGILALGLGAARALRFTLIAAVVAAAAWPVAPPQFRDRIITLNSLEEDYNLTSISGRKAVAKRGMTYFARNPVFGVGLGNFTFADGRYLKEAGIQTKWMAPHNTYVQVLADLGLVGALMFVAMFVTTIRRAAQLWRRTRARVVDPYFHRPELLGSVTGYALAAYFLSHAYFYPMFGLLAVVAFTHRVWLAEQVSGATQRVEAAYPTSVPMRRPLLRRGGLARSAAEAEYPLPPFPA
jgi:O-antigen ligase